MANYYIAKHGFSDGEVIFFAEMLAPPQPNKEVLSEERLPRSASAHQ
jgi:hypothetical protein